ncbi:MAG: hypothetical protein P1V13_24055, partial [Rhizobiaceae bacterium]|nr:hypothetical protein [Rhizobiaceae bacterium]
VGASCRAWVANAGGLHHPAHARSHHNKFDLDHAPNVSGKALMRQWQVCRFANTSAPQENIADF